MNPLIYPLSHSTESNLTMSQREVACKEGASPAFRTNNIADDKCHANSGAVDRRDGADDDNKENACNNNNGENHAKDWRDGDEDKAASPLFRTNIAADDECHADSDAVDRRDGADDDEEENAGDDDNDDKKQRKPCEGLT